ncbi:copper chaperone PCu(A)C [Rhizobiales bacterium]|uniref:copper chaperone PCu(A)C n=1 Tax=Hongsoonwoonella zoysiae TaxID=2821844 RepID=UPI00155F6058|nr:copper chaperone PCu(A)C [Hongsoonwoonella zoysiae]NRG19700.1 copper chaperone PCu(A)C [Hongsoonwoonella zoysiae]
MKLFKTLAVAAALTFASLSVHAEEIRIGDLAVSNGWTRATPPRAVAGGGFVTITNNGSEDDLLVSASAAVSGKAELHQMSVVDNIMKMRHLPDGVPIPAGETVELKPGGFHVMFLDLKEPLKKGDTLKVSLTFEKAGTVEVPFTIEKIGAKAPAHGAHGG